MRLDLAEVELVHLVELGLDHALVGVDRDHAVLGAGDALQAGVLAEVDVLAEGLHLAVLGLHEEVGDRLGVDRGVILGAQDDLGVLALAHDARGELHVVAQVALGVHVDEGAVGEHDPGAIRVDDGRHEDHTVLRAAHVPGGLVVGRDQDVGDLVGVLDRHGRVLDEEVALDRVVVALQRDDVVLAVEAGGDFDVELRVQLHVGVDVDDLELAVDDVGLADAEQVGGGNLAGLESRHEGGGGTRKGHVLAHASAPWKTGGGESAPVHYGT